jgi:hypothetical protein
VPCKEDDCSTAEKEENGDANEANRNDEPWEDEEDRMANYYITTNPLYNHMGVATI